MSIIPLAYHVCPLWQEPDGTRRVGFDEDPNHPLVVGWVCVLEMELDNERHALLLTGAE